MDANGKIEADNVSTPKGGNENRFQMLKAFITTSQTYYLHWFVRNSHKFYYFTGLCFLHMSYWIIVG
jgi:hypothetical protein